MDKNINLENAIKTILREIGENEMRDGLIDTPERVSRSIRETLSGYNEDIDKIMSKKFKLENPSKDIVRVNSIEFFSLCEHHLLPFFGIVNIEYIPDCEILGLSKFGRIVNAFSKRLQVQENLTKQIGNTIIKYLNCHYVKVHVRATHMCMAMRGICKTTSFTETEFVYKK